MNALKVLFLGMGWLDWLAPLFFVGSWWAYARFARRRAAVQPTLLSTSNRVRHQWMMMVTWRTNRVIDGAVVQNLSGSTSFFASTTILVIGGLLAVLSANDRATELVKEVPFVAHTSVVVFDLKLLVMTAIFVYAFFCFTWSLRQYSFGALLVAAAPEREQFAERGTTPEAYARRAGAVMAYAADAFNDGLRAYYMAFAAMGWFFSPVAFIVATVGVIFILFRREFRSPVLAALREDGVLLQALDPGLSASAPPANQ